MNKTLTSFLTLVTLVAISNTSHASSSFKFPRLYDPNTPSLTIVNTISDVSGYVRGFVDKDGNVNGDMFNPNNVSILYPISGIVYATITDPRSGETLGSLKEAGSVTATAAFSTSFLGLMGDWSLLPATLPWTMTSDFAMIVSGSTFKFQEELTGRAFPHLGPVENPALTGTMALRMAGCAAIRETTGSGAYANKVGTLCLNGTFTFDQQFNGKGVSNCTIALHDKIQ